VIDKSKGSEAIFLVGETGCGKSTIFNWLMGNELRAVKNNDSLVSQW
jgi:ABC-type nitrate/sulfonate/bicarbonate transport system ATPase subunit